MKLDCLPDSFHRKGHIDVVDSQWLKCVDPQTLEARIVAVADELFVDEIYWRTKRQLKAHTID